MRVFKEYFVEEWDYFGVVEFYARGYEGATPVVDLLGGGVDVERFLFVDSGLELVWRDS